jgi:ABC-type molybdate transport system ATPase subunit
MIQLRSRLAFCHPPGAGVHWSHHIPRGKNEAERVAIITKKSSLSLGLAVGKDAYAVIKASSVMVAVD